MDREEYAQKMKLILGDADKYWIIQCDPTLKIEKKISESLKHLQKEGYIDDRLCDFLFMEDLKDQAMHSSPLQPSLWLRYVDGNLSSGLAESRTCNPSTHTSTRCPPTLTQLRRKKRGDLHSWMSW